jgi:hypothetical protein
LRVFITLSLSRGGSRQPLTRSRRVDPPRLCTRMGAPSSAGVCNRTPNWIFRPDPTRPSPDVRCRIPPNVHHQDHAASASSRGRGASPRSPERDSEPNPVPGLGVNYQNLAVHRHSLQLAQQLVRQITVVRTKICSHIYEANRILLHRNFPANRCELQQEIKLCLYVQLQQL